MIKDNLEMLYKLNISLKQTTNNELKNYLKCEIKEQENKLIYLLVIEAGKRELAEDIEENTIDMEKLKTNKHHDNYTTEEQQRHYFTKS